jgi:methyl-accepting chemotaxis protein
MAEINESSRKIEDILYSIDEIAFQTNLLAVNAAIEAARAGQEGRGFAVVAQEVRALAQRSAVAAKQIKTLITDSVSKVEKGSELVNHSGQTLQEIVGSVKRAAEMVGQISHASSEQATGIEQVNTSVTQMNRVTQSSSEQTDRLSHTAQHVSQKATELKKLLARFILSETPSSSQQPTAARG